MGSAGAGVVDDSAMAIRPGADHGHNLERAAADRPPAGGGGALRQGLNHLGVRSGSGRAAVGLGVGPQGQLSSYSDAGGIRHQPWSEPLIAMAATRVCELVPRGCHHTGDSGASGHSSTSAPCTPLFQPQLKGHTARAQVGTVPKPAVVAAAAAAELVQAGRQLEWLRTRGGGSGLRHGESALLLMPGFSLLRLSSRTLHDAAAGGPCSQPGKGCGAPAPGGRSEPGRSARSGLHGPRAVAPPGWEH